jgi:hypothetical protein
MPRLFCCSCYFATFATLSLSLLLPLTSFKSNKLLGRDFKSSDSTEHPFISFSSVFFHSIASLIPDKLLPTTPLFPTNLLYSPIIIIMFTFATAILTSIGFSIYSSHHIHHHTFPLTRATASLGCFACASLNLSSSFCRFLVPF